MFEIMSPVSVTVELNVYHKLMEVTPNYKCRLNMEASTEWLYVYPVGDPANYIRIFVTGDNTERVAVYLDCKRICAVSPDEFGYDIEDMFAYAHAVRECKDAVSSLLERLDQTCNVIRDRYIEIPSSVALGMAFNKFLVHSCDNIWDDDENDKLYFAVRGESLPNEWLYCLNYRDMSLCVVDGKDNEIVNHYACDLCEAFVNDRLDMLEV